MPHLSAGRRSRQARQPPTACPQVPSRCTYPASASPRRPQPPAICRQSPGPSRACWNRSLAQATSRLSRVAGQALRSPSTITDTPAASPSLQGAQDDGQARVGGGGGSSRRLDGRSSGLGHKARTGPTACATGVVGCPCCLPRPCPCGSPAVHHLQPFVGKADRQHAVVAALQGHHVAAAVHQGVLVLGDGAWAAAGVQWARGRAGYMTRACNTWVAS